MLTQTPSGEGRLLPNDGDDGTGARATLSTNPYTLSSAPNHLHVAGRTPVDRLSVNIELPTREALTALAPEKSDISIKRTMGEIRLKLDEKADGGAKAPRFSPAGQSTQLIVGADDSSDASIMDTADTLYRSYRLRRIYYSAFSPIQRASARLPNRAPPLIREHRLYQADWLMRYYEFSLGELAQAMPGGKLDLHVDPKTTWALANRELFPVDVNNAERHLLLRVPGLGVKLVDRIVSSRRHRRLRYEDLQTMGAPLQRARHFLCTADYRPPQGERSTDSLRRALGTVPQQQSLF